MATQEDFLGKGGFKVQSADQFLGGGSFKVQQPEEAGIQPETKDTFLEGHKVLKGISDFVGTTGLGRGIAQGIFLKFTNEGKNLLKLVEQGQLKEADVEKIIGKTATTKEILGSAAQTALTAVAFGKTKGMMGRAVANVLPVSGWESGAFKLMKGAEFAEGGVQVGKGLGAFAKSAGAQAVRTGGLLGAGGAADAYGEGKDKAGILREAAKGFGLGAGFSIAGALVKGVLSQSPTLLSITSQVPEKALKRGAERPAEMALAKKQVKVLGDKGVFKETQKAVPVLRKALTDSWKEGTERLVGEFENVKVGYGEKEVKNIAKIFKQYGEDVPKNLTNMSFKENLDLYKTINAIKKGSLEESAEGYVIRELAKTVRDRLVKSFGGVGGKTDEFLKDYASRKGVLDSFDTIVRAYEEENPKTMRAAFNALEAVFKDRSGAFVDAVAAMEKVTGRPMLDKIASLYSQDILPRRMGEFNFGELMRLILAPMGITSPRGAAMLSRTAGRIAQSGEGTASTLVKGLLKTAAK